jgi:hypothetical protein
MYGLDIDGADWVLLNRRASNVSGADPGLLR